MKSILLLFIFFIGIIHIHAQDKQYLSTPMEIFSKKKTAYITTNDGTEFQGKRDL